MEKTAKKELIVKLQEQIKATLAEVNAVGAEKVNKSARKAARKLSNKFSEVLEKLEKKAGKQEKTGKKDKKKALKASRKAEQAALTKNGAKSKTPTVLKQESAGQSQPDKKQNPKAKKK